MASMKIVTLAVVSTSVAMVSGADRDCKYLVADTSGNYQMGVPGACNIYHNAVSDYYVYHTWECAENNTVAIERFYTDIECQNPTSFPQEYSIVQHNCDGMEDCSFEAGEYYSLHQDECLFPYQGYERGVYASTVCMPLNNYLDTYNSKYYFCTADGVWGEAFYTHDDCTHGETAYVYDGCAESAYSEIQGDSSFAYYAVLYNVSYCNIPESLSDFGAGAAGVSLALSVLASLFAALFVVA